MFFQHFKFFEIVEVRNFLYALVIRTENRSISHTVVHVSPCRCVVVVVVVRSLVITTLIVSDLTHTL